MEELMNIVRRATGKGFKVVRGKYGRRMVLTGPWSEMAGRWMQKKGVDELELNYIHGCDVGTDYRFLAQVPFLAALRIVKQSPKDFSPLGELRNLRSLEIDLAPKPEHLDLGVLKELEALELNWFSGADRLFVCQKLKQLSIDYYPKGLGSSPFERLTELEDLRLANGGIEEVRHFSALKRLTRLQLLNLTHLESIQGIESLQSLKRIRIDGCRNIGSIDAVRNLRELEFLWLVDCGDIESLAPVRKLSRLKSLMFGGNTKIRDGDIKVLLDLPALSHWGFASLAHYNIKPDTPALIAKEQKAKHLASYHF